jgi:hypothetical protein
MFAAGLEYSDEQLARSVSPGRYRNKIPSIVGLFSGISVQINDGKNVIKKGLHEFWVTFDNKFNIMGILLWDRL